MISSGLVRICAIPQRSPLNDVCTDPISGRYVRLNKQGSINNSPCTGVSWVPSSPSLFLVSHADGTIIVYDKERDDGAFTPQDPGTVPQSAGLSLPSPLPGPASHSESSSTSIPSDESPATGNEWNPLDSIFVTMPRWHPVSAQTSRTEKEKDKMPKNPVSHWRVSRRAVLSTPRLESGNSMWENSEIPFPL